MRNGMHGYCATVMYPTALSHLCGSAHMLYREQAVADVFLNQGAHAVRVAGDVGVS